MGNIDNLSFNLLLNDKDFDAKIRKHIESVQNLNRELEKAGLSGQASMSEYLETQKQVNKAVLEQLKHEQKVQREIDKTNSARLRGELAVQQSKEKLHTQELRSLKIQQQINNEYRHGGSLLSQLGTYAATYFSVMGAERVIKNLVRVTGEFEMQRTTLRAILQDIGAADVIYGQIRDFAVKSPFSFMELSSYVKQLSAYSIPVKELFDTTKMLADVSAGLGVDMNRIVLAYGQIRSASFLRGQEVRQLTEAGIPILTELAKQFEELEGRAVSAGEVFDKISARQVPFEMVAKVFKSMTSEGGKFYKMQEIQAETLKGKLSNLKDAFDIMFSEIGDKGMPIMKGAVDWVRKLASDYEHTGRVIVELIATYGLYKAALTTIKLATGELALANTALNKSFLKIVKNPYALLAAGATAAAYTIYKHATALSYAEKVNAGYNKGIEEVNKAMNEETAALDSLFIKLKSLNEGTEEYADTRKALFTKYASYISELKAEGVEVQNLGDLYEGLKTKVEDSVKARLKSSVRQGLDETFSNQMDAASKQAKKIINQSGFRDIKQNGATWNSTNDIGLQAYITGSQSLRKLIEDGMLPDWLLPENINRDKELKGAGWKGRTLVYDRISELRREVQTMQEAYTESLKDLAKVLETGAKEIEDIPEPPTRFAEIVQGVLAKYGMTDEGTSKGLWAKNDTDYFGYLETIRKRYKELQEQIMDSGNAMKSFVPEYKKQREIIEALFKALGVGPEEPKKIMQGKKTAGQTAIEQYVDNLKALKSAYDDLAPYLDDETMKTLLAYLFPHIDTATINALKFEEQIIDKAKELAKYDPGKAKDIMDSVSKGGATDIVALLRQATELEKVMRTLRDETLLEGTGVTFDVSRIVSDYEKALNGIEEKRRSYMKEFEQATTAGKALSPETMSLLSTIGFDMTEALDAEGFREQLDLWASAQTQNALAKATDSIDGLADAFVKDWAKVKGINLSDWGDMSAAQIRDVLQQINAAFDDEGNLIVEQNTALDAIRKVLGENSALWKMFSEAAGAALGSKGAEGKGFLKKDNIKSIKYAAKAILELTDALGEYAKVSGNDGLERTSEAIHEISDATKEIAEGYAATGSWVGAVIAGVKVYVEGLLKVSASYEQMRESARNARLEMQLFNQAESYKSGDSPFGERFGEGFKKAMADYAEHKGELKAFLQDTEFMVRTHKATFWEQLGASFGNGFAYDTVLNLRALLDSYGTDYNNLDSIIAGLQKVRDTYSDLTDGQKEYLDSTISNLEKLKAADEKLAGVLQDIYGDIASDAANAIIDRWIEAGDAAADYTDILKNVEAQYARLILQDAILENVFDEERKARLLKAMQNNDSEALDKEMRDIEKELQQFDNQATRDFLSRYSFLNDNAIGNTLASGIKSVTEETASLLASYVNGIRADVAYAKEQRAEILQMMRVMGEPMPTLADYLNTIQAHTANMSEKMSRMWDRIDALTTYDGGNGAALRTYM